MTSSLLSRKTISSLLLTSFVVMASPISAIYAAAVIAEVTPIPTPSTNTTPTYTFSSDAIGSINYAGFCSSATNITVVGNNTITLNPLTDGTYSTCTIDVDDGFGLSNILTISTFVIDTTAPVVTLDGSGTVNIITGQSYTDSGASWTDNIDGADNLLVGIYGTNGSFQSSGSVNTAQSGTYLIEYLKVDATGNSGSTTRTIIVTDGDVTPPVVTLVGSGTENILVGTPYVDSGATWTDNVDGSGTIATYNSGTLNTSVVGVYQIGYFYVDVAGNTGSVTRTVNVTTGNVPVITLIGSGTINILSGAVYTDSGATASDVEDGNLTSSIVTSGSVNTNVAGTYLITYNVTDSHSNAAIQVTRTVNVNAIVDTTPPVITLIGSNPITINVGSSYTDAGASWTDNIDGSGLVVATGLLNTTIAGSYTLSYDKTDVAGNTGTTVTRTVNVIALASVSFTMVGGGGAGGGSSNNSSDVVMNSASSQSSQAILTDDELIPSISRLLRKFSTQTNDSASEVTSSTNSNQYTITNPVTDYICPVVDEFYDMNNEQVANVSEGEFTPDVQALLMYRSAASTEQGINYSSRFLMNNGFAIASNNESYDGSRAITRAEFVKMLVRALSCHYVPTTASSTFSDVGPDAWYTEYITFATEQGWITGYEDGTFGPHNTITRAEAAKILAAAIQIDTTSMSSDDASFSDVPSDSLFAPSIYALKASGIIGGKTESTYDMNSSLSRNEVARIFHNTFLNLE